MVEEGKLRTESKKTVYVSDLVGVEYQNHDRKILNKELPLGKLIPTTENYQKKIKSKQIKPPTQEELKDPDMFKKRQLKRREEILEARRLRAKKAKEAKK